MNERAFFVPPNYNYYSRYATRQMNISMANRIQMPRLVNNIKPVPIPIKVPVAVKQVKVKAVPVPVPVPVDRAVPIPIKVPIPVKVPVHLSSTPYPYHRQSVHKPSPTTHYKTSVPASYFSPIPGMAKNAYNTPDPKTNTFKSVHGHFYSPHQFYSPAPNVSNPYTPSPYKTPNPFGRPSNLVTNPFQIPSPSVKSPYQQQQQQHQNQSNINTSQMLKEMHKQLPSYLQKHLQEQMIRQAANAAGTGMFQMYPYMANSNLTGRPSNVPAVQPNPPPVSNSSPYEPSYSNRYPVDSTAKRDSKPENVQSGSSSNPPSIQSASAPQPPPPPPPSQLQPTPLPSSVSQPQTSTTKEDEPILKEVNKSEEKLIFKEPAYSELFQKLSESNKLNEDIRSKIDYLYQSTMPKNSKGNLKKSLTISPIVNQLEGYESLDACTTEKVKSHEIIIDNSNRNISMINDTIKDINHKIKKLKRSSRTRS